MSHNNLLLLSHEITSILEKAVYKQTGKKEKKEEEKRKEKSKSAIPFWSGYLARIIYKLCLNSRNTKYSQNVTISEKWI